VSYSVYLLHYPVFRLYEDLGPVRGWLGLALFILSILAFGQVSFMILESPARKAIRAKLPFGRACVRGST